MGSIYPLLCEDEGWVRARRFRAEVDFHVCQKCLWHHNLYRSSSRYDLL